MNSCKEQTYFWCLSEGLVYNFNQNGGPAKLLHSNDDKMAIVVKGGGRRSTQQRPGKEEPLVGVEEGAEKEVDQQGI